jgi:cell division protein FtsQ
MRKWLKIAFAVVFASTTLLLWIYSRQQQQLKVVSKPNIYIDSQNGIALINEHELSQALYSNGLYYDSIQRSEIDIKKIEKFAQALNEVEKAQAYMELGGNWHLDLRLRKPIVRVIPEDQEEFYIDNRGKAMWVTQSIKPKVLPITGLKSTDWGEIPTNQLINNDSLITISPLSDSYRISKYVCSSAFYDALLVQIHHTKEDGFVLIPRVGNHKIIFGSATSEKEVVDKFNKLTTFYHEVIPYEGWNKYQSINLKYKNQIVAKKK